MKPIAQVNRYFQWHFEKHSAKAVPVGSQVAFFAASNFPQQLCLKAEIK
jgi:hypothetical protein